MKYTEAKRYTYCSIIILCIPLFLIAVNGCLKAEEPVAEPEKPLLAEEKEDLKTEEKPDLEETDSIYYIDYDEGDTPISELPLGTRVVDFTWEWDFRAGNDYTNKAGDFARPVTWIIVARDHYNDLDPHITLLSEDIIGFYTFDNSTNQEGYRWGHSHWGNSGGADASVGLRPWLNSTDIHKEEGFFQAFSSSFKNSIITTVVPNLDNSGYAYNSKDKVFVPSTTELGDTLHDLTAHIGECFPYFSAANDKKRISNFKERPRPYWTRSPVSYDDNDSIYSVEADGSFNRFGVFIYRGSTGVRPALNLKPETMVSRFKPDIDHDVLIVNVNYLRLRSGPGTSYEILDRLMKGNKLRLIDSNKEWRQVKTAEGEIGWVYKDYVDDLSAIESKINYAATDLVYPQPVGQSDLAIISFVEKATSFYLIDFVIPEFDHPNDINNEDMIKAIVLNRLVPKNYPLIHGKDVQATAELIFGPDLKNIEHSHVFPYDWLPDDETYRVVGFGPANYTKTKVLDIKETELEFIVDTVHLIVHYPPDGMEGDSYITGEQWRGEYYDNIEEYDDFEDYLDNKAVKLSDNYDEIINTNAHLFPVRRYILSKEENDVCYIRKSYILNGN